MFQDKKQKVIKTSTDSHNISYGFLNRTNNKSLFINITSWVTIVSEEEHNYNELFNLVVRGIKKYLNTKQSFHNNDFYLVDLGMRKSGLGFNSTSFLDLEITLFNKGVGYFEPSVELDSQIKEMVKDITETYLKDNEIFIYRHKK